MDNVNVNIDFAKIKGGFSYKIQGSTGVKECICFPKEIFYQGKDGALYLNITGIDAGGRFGKLYSLKQSVPYEKYKAMSPEERKAMPFIGDIKPAGGKPSDSPAPHQATANNEDDGDLPF